MSLKDKTIMVTGGAEAWASGSSRPWWIRVPR